MHEELRYPGRVKRGDRGSGPRRVQEWLCLNGCHVSVDGIFGPATHAALRGFQTEQGITRTGNLTRAAFERLTARMSLATAALRDVPASLGEAVVAHARQHLAQHPREIGGQNRGPWVRLYMDGHEGEPWPWCAGFVCFVVQQACRTFGVPMPFPKTYSCDVLAVEGRARGIFLSERSAAADLTQLAPGSVFLNRRTSTDWTHTGILVSVDTDEVFATIEGNTNDEGSREGYEVCARVRGFGGKDFLRIGKP